MPVLKSAGFVDMRILTLTINEPITLHYIVRSNITSHTHELFFLLREIHSKILTSENSLDRNDQAVRTVVNSFIHDRHEWTTPIESRAFKSINLLTPRAPRAALISSSVLISLLRYFECDIKALVLECCLVNIINEGKMLKSVLLGLNAAVQRANRAFGLANDDATTVSLTQSLHAPHSLSYPPDWANHYRNGLNDTTPIAPLDIQGSMSLISTLRSPKPNFSYFPWVALITHTQTDPTNNLLTDLSPQSPLAMLREDVSKKNANVNLTTTVHHTPHCALYSDVIQYGQYYVDESEIINISNFDVTTITQSLPSTDQPGVNALTTSLISDSALDRSNIYGATTGGTLLAKEFNRLDFCYSTSHGPLPWHPDLPSQPLRPQPSSVIPSQDGQMIINDLHNQLPRANCRVTLISDSQPHCRLLHHDSSEDTDTSKLYQSYLPRAPANLNNHALADYYSPTIGQLIVPFAPISLCFFPPMFLPPLPANSRFPWLFSDYPQHFLRNASLLATITHIKIQHALQQRFGGTQLLQSPTALTTSNLQSTITLSDSTESAVQHQLVSSPPCSTHTSNTIHHLNTPMVPVQESIISQVSPQDHPHPYLEFSTILASQLNSTKQVPTAPRRGRKRKQSSASLAPPPSQQSQAAYSLSEYVNHSISSMSARPAFDPVMATNTLCAECLARFKQFIILPQYTTVTTNTAVEDATGTTVDGNINVNEDNQNSIPSLTTPRSFDPTSASPISPTLSPTHSIISDDGSHPSQLQHQQQTMIVTVNSANCVLCPVHRHLLQCHEQIIADHNNRQGPKETTPTTISTFNSEKTATTTTTSITHQNTHNIALSPLLSNDVHPTQTNSDLHPQTYADLAMSDVHRIYNKDNETGSHSSANSASNKDFQLAKNILLSRPPFDAYLRRSKFELSPLSFQFLSLPGTIPFHLLYIMSVLYFHQRYEKYFLRQSNIHHLSSLDSLQGFDYIHTLLPQSFNWILNHLKYPITYSTTLIEFDHKTTHETIYTDPSTIPDLYILPDYRLGNNGAIVKKKTKTVFENLQPATLPTSFPAEQQGLTNTRGIVDLLVEDVVEDCRNSASYGQLGTNLLQQQYIADRILYNDLTDDEYYFNNNFFTTEYGYQFPVRSDPKPATGYADADIDTLFIKSNMLSPNGKPIVHFDDKINENEFPYEITYDNIPYFRSFLWHLLRLPYAYKLRLLRHANCLYTLEPQTQRMTEEEQSETDDAIEQQTLLHTMINRISPQDSLHDGPSVDNDPSRSVHTRVVNKKRRSNVKITQELPQAPVQTQPQPNQKLTKKSIPATSVFITDQQQPININDSEEHTDSHSFSTFPNENQYVSLTDQIYNHNYPPQNNSHNSLSLLNPSHVQPETNNTTLHFDNNSLLKNNDSSSLTQSIFLSTDPNITVHNVNLHTPIPTNNAYDPSFEELYFIPNQPYEQFAFPFNGHINTNHVPSSSASSPIIISQTFASSPQSLPNEQHFTAHNHTVKNTSSFTTDSNNFYQNNVYQQLETDLPFGSQHAYLALSFMSPNAQSHYHRHNHPMSPIHPYHSVPISTAPEINDNRRLLQENPSNPPTNITTPRFSNYLSPMFNASHADIQLTPQQFQDRLQPYAVGQSAHMDLYATLPSLSLSMAHTHVPHSPQRSLFSTLNSTQTQQHLNNLPGSPTALHNQQQNHNNQFTQPNTSPHFGSDMP